jgi:hypothetical protein
MIDSSENRELDAEWLIEGYRQLAADHEREQEALEWCEALIADAAEPDDADSIR